MSDIKIATLVKSDNTQSYVAPKDTKDFTLEEIQAFCGGFVEMIYTEDGREVWMNEEGRIKGLPENKYISDLLKTSVVGDCLVVIRE